MKILTGIDIPFNPFGGSPIICDDWYSQISAGGDEVMFLTMKPDKNEKWWNMENVTFLKTKKVRDPSKYLPYLEELTKEVKGIISSFKPDIIHAQHLNYGLSRAFIDAAGDIPIVGICHGTDTQIAKQYDFFKQNLIEITDKVDHLVFPAQNMADDFFDVYNKKKKHSIFPHGLPSNIFSKHMIHKQENILRLLYAGRLNNYKGADIAIEAIAYTKHPVSLDVIGKEDEKDYLNKLKKIVDLKEISHKVNFYSQVTRSQLLDKYSEYDCILIPSRSLEAFSLTSVEAQARGLIVIYGNGGGITDVVSDSGILIKDNNPKTLAKIIDKINTNRDSLVGYRNRGYKNAQKYKIENQIKSIMDLSKKLIRNNLK